MISGIDSNIDISEILKLNNLGFNFGLSHLNRYQKLDAGFGEPENVQTTGARFDYSIKIFMLMPN